MAYLPQDDLVSGTTRQFTSPDTKGTFKVLVAYADAGNHTTFRTIGGAVYQAPAGGFKIKQLVGYSNAAGSFDVGYGDDSKVNTTAPTNPIFATSGTSSSNTCAYLPASAGYPVPCDFTIPSGKYPFVKCGAAQAVYALGYEY